MGASDTTGSPSTKLPPTRKPNLYCGKPYPYSANDRALAKSCGKSLPPLHSPKPLGKHHSTPWRQPWGKPVRTPGIPRRTLPLRPNGSHHYARVVTVADKLSRDGKYTGMKLVGLEYKDPAGFICSVNSNTTAVL